MSLLRGLKPLSGLCLMFLTPSIIQAQHNYDFIGLDPQQPTVWTIAANWNCLNPQMGGCLYPGTGDNASIGRRDMNGIYTIYSVRATATQAVNDLTIFNGSTLNFTNFTSGGTVNLGDLPSSTATISSIASPGAYNNNGTMNLTGLAGGPFNTFSGAFTFFNNGTVNLGRLFTSGAITLVNQPTGVFFIGDGTLTAGGGTSFTFNNLGFFHKPSSPGTASITSGVFINGATVSNQTGTVDVGNGTLMFGLPVTSNCAVWKTLTAAASIVFTGPFTANPCTINTSPDLLRLRTTSLSKPAFINLTITSMGGAGPITLQNNVTINVNSEVLAGIPGSPSHVKLQMLSLDGAGDFHAASDGTNPTIIDWNHGGIGGSGKFDIDSGATLNIALDGDTNIGGRIFNNSGSINWTSGNIGSMNVTAATLNNLPTGVVELRSNSFLAGGNPTTVVNNSGTFRKTAGDGVSQISAIFNNNGLVAVQNGALRLSQGSSSGTFNITNNTVLDFLTISPGYSFNAGTTITGSGTALIRGPVNVNANVSAFAVQMMGGTLNGPGDLNISGFFNCDSGTLGGAGTLNIVPNGILNFPTNSGCNVNRNINNNGATNIPPGAVITSDNDFDFNNQVGGLVNVEGNSTCSRARLKNSGTLSLFNHTTIITGKTTFKNVVFRRLISSRLEAAAKGVNAGTQYSQLIATENATFGGTFKWALAPGFVPNVGDSFQPVTYVSHDGNFDRIEGLNAGNARIFKVVYSPISLILTTTAIDNSLPAPTVNSISNDATTDTTTIKGNHHGNPNTSYTISIFTDFPNSQAPNSVFPETSCDTSSGGALVGMTTVTTDGSGNASFTVTISPALSLTQIISAIASDNNNSSSNFSTCTQIGSQMQLDAAAYMVNEGDGFATINVTRTGNTLGTSTVDYATSDGTALQRSRYTITSGTVTFGPGEAIKSFQVLVTDNLYVDGPQTVILNLSNPTGTSAVGSPGAATLTVNDNDTNPPTTNPLDNSDERFFVQQHYYDFLSRYPDQGGWDYWVGEITRCGGDATCLHNRRVDVSNAFFFELEFQQTGSYVYRLYRVAFGNTQPFPNPDNSNQTEAKKLPSYAVFASDRARVVGGVDLVAGQQNVANLFVQRAEFLAKYPANFDGPGFVDAVLATIKNDLNVDLGAQRTALINLYNSGGRGAVIYRLADDNVQTNPINNRALIDAEYNRAFVFTQYCGYLRRDADIGGFSFWLFQVNNGPLRDITRQHAMVCSFITSAEYQQRFSPVVTHSNQECPH